MVLETAADASKNLNTFQRIAPTMYKYYIFDIFKVLL